MRSDHSKKNFQVITLILMMFAVILCCGPRSYAGGPIKLILDDVDITSSAQPVIQNGRVLVPVRFVSENLGAQVDWDGSEKTVRITKGDRSVLLRTDSRLVEYLYKTRTYDLCDTAPQIINGLTFVPLRLVANSLGTDVRWDNDSRTVYIESDRNTGISAFFDMRILSLTPDQIIEGPMDLRSYFPSRIPEGAEEIKYLLLDTKTAMGTIIAGGSELTKAYRWIPEPQQNGDRILVAAVYDGNGRFLAGDPVPVRVKIVPEVTLTGIAAGQTVSGPVTVGVSTNFLAYFVKYTITDLDSYDMAVSPESDPQGQYIWTPMMEDNGDVSIRATAYDRDGRAYESGSVKVSVKTALILSVSGIPSDKIIDGPVTLSVTKNFQVSQTEYVLIDPQTGDEKILAKVSDPSIKWFPGPAFSGAWKILVRVKDIDGMTFTSDAVNIDLTGKPKLLLEGIGPQQVITGPVKLKVSSNVVLESVKYVLVDPETGEKRILSDRQDPLAVFSYIPVPGDAGAWKVQAESNYGGDKNIISGAIPVRIYTGRIYPPVPIIGKNMFIDMVSEWACDTRKRTGMSAALQIAQAILESNWGQNIPVDKYSGQLSYNLFGIKGTGTAGSVISNTWEEYNGVSFRVDDNFRAYNNAFESWTDHENLLITKSRYQIFRDVMYDSALGAWAIKRAGYATDSKYPLKLLDIIKTYDLQRFDQTGID